MKLMQRRAALTYLLASPALSVLKLHPTTSFAPSKRLKISLNAYSFNAPLIANRISVEQMMDFCVSHGFEGLDLTCYYLPGYPQVPSDDYLFSLKRKLHQIGLELSGTGCRNDFVFANKSDRDREIQLVKNWVDATAKLGAPVLRVFAGKSDLPGYSWGQISNWVVDALKECTDYASKKGIIIGIQNHNDFIKTADQVIDILQRVNSPWCGLILDVGSFREKEVYAEIEKAIPYAVNWQLKETIFAGKTELPIDLKKTFELIRASNYRGYVPIETLRKGDPGQIVPEFLAQVKPYIF
jgi:sugar phosphate isomerase/epimerase